MSKVNAVWVRIEFPIDREMITCAIESMLYNGKKVSRRSVIALCRMHIQMEGERFITEPLFDDEVIQDEDLRLQSMDLTDELFPELE